MAGFVVLDAGPGECIRDVARWQWIGSKARATTTAAARKKLEELRELRSEKPTIAIAGAGVAENVIDPLGLC